MRLAELMGTLSLAADTGMGMPAEQGLRSAAAAVRLGEICGVPDAEIADAFYLVLLRYAGCTADSDLATDVMGDEVAVRGALYGVDWGAPTEVMPRLVRAVARGKGKLQAAVAVGRALTKMPKLLATARSHCEVGDRLAESIGFGESFRAALFQSFERWDGTGWPNKIKGEAIARPMRLAQAGEEIQLGHGLGGVDGARALLKKRAGRGVDPKLAERFDGKAEGVCASLDVASAWATALELEPEPHRIAGDDQVDLALQAMGDFADLKSRFTRGHASGVASLARRAVGEMRFTETEERMIERAALVHDLGRVAISAGIWDKPGPLRDTEWEQVRAHSYVGERLLARAMGLRAIAEVATLAHERLDGSGYHRRISGTACTPLAGILAAADVYHALTEQRSHRPSHGADEAAAKLSAMAREGVLSQDAVSSVLAAAGQTTPRRRGGPSGLTEREIVVIRLVARGLTNKEVATELDISTKTAGNHIQHIFEKIGVTTRAAATMFAMQKGLVA